MTIANAHTLFNGLISQPSFLARITIDDVERARLLSCQRIIRSAIREAADTLAANDEFWEQGYIGRPLSKARRTVSIKFMTQGSFAYKTLNRPAFVPHQEIDLDDGMYVPVDFLDDDQPALMALGLFSFVEAALLPVCNTNGWHLDRSKPNCVRVKLWQGAHIDIPIYSIPRDQYATIVEKRADAVGASRIMAIDSSSRIDTDKVMLAQRNGTWTHSDPLELKDWVDRCVRRYGPIYVRLVRFFKAWRDKVWIKPALSSICLMHAVDIALQELNLAPVENRDDEMILTVAKRLPAVLEKEVCNPVIRESCLNDWDSKTRADIVAHMAALGSFMEQALQRSDTADKVIARLVDGFGERIPDAPTAVKFTESRIQVIQQAKPAHNPVPRVVPSTSG